MAAEYAILCREIPSPHCALNFENPYQLLIATVLSAQTTDKRVNQVTPTLFAHFANPKALAQADPSEVENIIHPVGFYHSKASRIIALSARLDEVYHGTVPTTMQELTSLPGVGRKTANVVLGNAFDTPGFPVDTHVIRVTGRLRWRSDWNSPTPDPVRIEQEITACFPPQEWTDLSLRLIAHGRTVCLARRPHCEACALNETCPSACVVAK